MAATRAPSSLQLLSPRDVCARLKLARSSLDLMVSMGEFPKPFKIGKHNRWRESAVEELLRVREAARPRFKVKRA